jgi:hypothetical protein
MDQTIEAIAKEVSRHLSASEALTLQVVLRVGAAALAAFFGAYLRERGSCWNSIIRCHNQTEHSIRPLPIIDVHGIQAGRHQCRFLSPRGQ